MNYKNFHSLDKYFVFIFTWNPSYSVEPIGRKDQKSPIILKYPFLLSITRKANKQKSALFLVFDDHSPPTLFNYLISIRSLTILVTYHCTTNCLSFNGIKAMIIYYRLSWFWALTWLSWLVVAQCLSCGFSQMESLSYFDGLLIPMSHDGCRLLAGTLVGPDNQIPTHGLSMWTGLPHSMEAIFRAQPGVQQRCTTFADLASQGMLSHFPFYSVDRSF